MQKTQKNYQTGFTLIELIVSVAIIAVLSLIVLFSVTQYIDKGKDANVSANLAVLVPSGEAYYNVENSNNGDGYTGFCGSSAVTNVFAQVSLPNPVNDCASDLKTPGLCCTEADDGDSWAACAQEFTNPKEAYCVDSSGEKEVMCNTSCSTSASITACPDPSTVDLSTCQ